MAASTRRRNAPRTSRFLKQVAGTDGRGNVLRWAKLRLQPRLDGAEQPEAHLAVIARERDHETHPAAARGVGIARERADPRQRAGLVHAAVMAAEQAGMGREELEHFGEAAGGKAVVATDAGAFLEMDGRSEAVRGEHLVRDLE